MDKPPASLDAVSRNLAIVRELLAASRKDPEMVALLDRVAIRVYREIDEFIDATKYVLSVELEIRTGNKDTIVAEATAKLASIAVADPKDPRVKFCGDMLKDLQYVVRMKELETTTERVGCLDVVPVSGLVLGRFTRFENELQTVLSIWSKPQSPTPTPATEPISSPKS
jgi:hypothetical protein